MLFVVYNNMGQYKLRNRLLQEQKYRHKAGYPIHSYWYFNIRAGTDAGRKNAVKSDDLALEGVFEQADNGLVIGLAKHVLAVGLYGAFADEQSSGYFGIAHLFRN